MAASKSRKKPWCAASCLLLGLLFGAGDSRAASQAVDLELVITTDVSFSVDDNEARMQREGRLPLRGGEHRERQREHCGVRNDSLRPRSSRHAEGFEAGDMRGSQSSAKNAWPPTRTVRRTTAHPR